MAGASGPKVKVRRRGCVLEVGRGTEDPEWPESLGPGGEGGEPRSGVTGSSGLVRARLAGGDQSAGVCGQLREGVSALPEAKGPESRSLSIEGSREPRG